MTYFTPGYFAQTYFAPFYYGPSGATPTPTPTTRPSGADPGPGVYYKRFGKGKRGQIEARELAQQALDIVAVEPDVAPEIADFAAELRAKAIERDMARLFENQRLMDALVAIEPEVKRIAEIRRILRENERDEEDAIAVILMMEAM